MVPLYILEPEQELEPEPEPQQGPVNTACIFIDWESE